jgi:hypothetical protein
MAETGILNFPHRTEGTPELCYPHVANGLAHSSPAHQRLACDYFTT